MNRAPRSLLILMVAATAAAQTATPPSAAGAGPAEATGKGDAQAAVLAAQPSAPVPLPSVAPVGPQRAASPEVEAALSLGRPKFSPPTPTPAALDVPQDMRTVDKPRNEIPRLPSYIVRDSRPPVFRDRDINTKEGLVSLSYKLHPGLGIGNLMGLNDAPAYEMFLADERLANIADLTDTARSIAAGGDRAEGEYILQQTQDTYLRPDQGFIWNGPGGGGNAGGGGK